MEKDKFEKYLEDIEVPKFHSQSHKHALRRALLNSNYFNKPISFWKRFDSMQLRRVVPASMVIAITFALVLGFGLDPRGQVLTNQAQAKEIVKETISRLEQLPYEERVRLNASLTVEVDRLLEDGYKASDLKYEEVPNSMEPSAPYKKITFTDSLGRYVTLNISNDNIPQWISINGVAPGLSVDGKRTFTSPELGVTFNYPDSYLDVSASINKGETGKILFGFMSKTKCDPLVSDCARMGILFGSASKDYTAGKGASGLEGSRVVKESGKYYSVGFGEKYEFYPEYEKQEIIAQNTVGVMVKGKEGASGPGDMWPTQRLVLFNLNSPDFEAITFIFDVTEVSEEEVLSILKTIKID